LKANVLTEEAAYYTSPIDKDLTFMLRNTSTNPKEWYVTVKRGRLPLSLKVDTGATCNVMPKSVFDSLDINVPLEKHANCLI